MKTQNLLKTALCALFALIMIGFTSCHNDDDMPKPPVDPITEFGHEEWNKVTFTFHRGHLHGSSFHGDAYNEDVKYLKTIQEFTIERDDKGNLVYSQEPIRLLKGRHFALEINYYNKDGKLINHEFATAQNAPIHQHFFLTKNAKKLNSNESYDDPKNILGYTYRDTNPVDKNIGDEGVVLRENDPLGLKGYFDVKENYVQFELNPILVHIVKGTKYKEDGTTYPFNDPYKGFLGTQDLNVRIPIRVFTSLDDYDQLIKDIAKEFNISEEEAEKDLELQWDTPDNGSYWM